MALTQHEVEFQLTEVIPRAGVLFDALFVERLAGQVTTLLILNTILRVAVTQRILNQIINHIVIGHPVTATERTTVMIVGHLTAEQETDTGGICFLLAFQDRAGKGDSTQEVVVTIDGTTQLDRAVEITRSGFGNRDYSRHFGKLEDRNTTLVERFHLRRMEGVYLDIFPLDDVPDNRMLRWLQYRRYRLFDKLLYFAYRDPYKHGDGFSSRMIAFFQKRMSRERLHSRMKAILTRYNGKKRCSCCMTHGGGYIAIPKTAYGKPAMYKFENGSYCGPADAVTYLTLSYGKDYIIPPPPEKRETHYFQYCDFDRGYETASFDELKRLYDEQKKK